jgi:hypothetical protein
MPEEIPKEKKRFVKQFEEHPILGNIGKELEKYKEISPAIRELLSKESQVVKGEFPKNYTNALRTVAILSKKAQEDAKLTPSQKEQFVRHYLTLLEKGKLRADTKLGSKESLKRIVEGLNRLFPNEKVTLEDMDYIRHFDNAMTDAIIQLRNAEREVYPEYRYSRVLEAHQKISETLERIQKIHNKIRMLQSHIETAEKNQNADLPPHVKMEDINEHLPLLEEASKALETLKSILERRVIPDPTPEKISGARYTHLIFKQAFRWRLQVGEMRDEIGLRTEITAYKIKHGIISP